MHSTAESFLPVVLELCFPVTQHVGQPDARHEGICFWRQKSFAFFMY